MHTRNKYSYTSVLTMFFYFSLKRQNKSVKAQKIVRKNKMLVTIFGTHRFKTFSSLAVLESLSEKAYRLKPHQSFSVLVAIWLQFFIITYLTL